MAAVTNFVTALLVGPPSDPAAQIGPLISEKQRTRVEGYIAMASRRALGWRGGGRPEGLDNASLSNSTVFAVDKQDDHLTGGDWAGVGHHSL